MACKNISLTGFMFRLLPTVPVEKNIEECDASIAESSSSSSWQLLFRRTVRTTAATGTVWTTAAAATAGTQLLS